MLCVLILLLIMLRILVGVSIIIRFRNRLILIRRSIGLMMRGRVRVSVNSLFILLRICLVIPFHFVKIDNFPLLYWLRVIT